jgi:hypothetical protein
MGSGHPRPLCGRVAFYAAPAGLKPLDWTDYPQLALWATVMAARCAGYPVTHAAGLLSAGIYDLMVTHPPRTPVLDAPVPPR